MNLQDLDLVTVGMLEDIMEEMCIDMDERKNGTVRWATQEDIDRIL